MHFHAKFQTKYGLAFLDMTNRSQEIKAFDFARRLAIQIVEVEHLAVVELARKTGFTTYDASYLWLARHLPGELVTLDRRMQAAAVP